MYGSVITSTGQINGYLQDAFQQYHEMIRDLGFLVFII
eukprot:Gb_10764 [translate_table: standard]